MKKQFAVMNHDVRLAGTLIAFKEGQIVELVPATNLPGSQTFGVVGEVSILLTRDDYTPLGVRRGTV